MLDLRSLFWTTDYPKNQIPRLSAIPQFSNSVIDEFLANVSACTDPSRPVLSNTEAEDAVRVSFAVALCQRGRYNEVLGTDSDPNPNPGPGKRRIHPEDRIADGSILPPILFLHGADDTAVPVAGTERFVEQLRKHRAVHGLREDRDEVEGEVLKFVTPPGDHGFENDLCIDEEEWLRDCVVFVERHWLG